MMTKQTSIGYISGNKVEVTVEGPEAQDIDDDRIGSDVLITRIESVLSELKASVNSDSDADGEEKEIPTFEGQVVFQGDYEPIESEAEDHAEELVDDE